MCGIAGFWEFQGDGDAASLNAVAKRMCEKLKHRGPDGSGHWVNDRAGIGFAHTRLSIIDLSRNGAQPMQSASGRYVITYNGELYNFSEVRDELSKHGVIFRGNSDTEVLLEAIECWGIKRALERSVGMFAFAVWDQKDQRLMLARDRIGEKPVYYGMCKGVFLFGSELKALMQHPRWQGEIDRNALCLYFRHNYIPDPYSIYKGINKLTPGCFVEISHTQGNESELLFSNGARQWFASKGCYWALGDHFRGNQNANAGARELTDRLDHLLRLSVRGQMVSDVPLGALLSGGIDSSTITALMQAQSNTPVKTFSIGFEQAEYNEAKYAAAVAEHLGTDHTELYVTPEETRDIIPNLCRYYDEPFADSSQIPTCLVSHLVRKSVTVCLSGDGGDELFAGYDRYLWSTKIWKSIGWMPQPMRKTMAMLLTAIPRSAWDVSLSPMKSYFGRYGMGGHLGHKAHRLADNLNIPGRFDLYKSLVSHWASPESLVLGGSEPNTLIDDCPQHKHRSFIEEMMYIDMLTYLPGDILTKVDRASMGTSLEVRVPFLDHRLIEFAWQVPLSFKRNEAKTKWLLRQVLDRYVPATLIDRPKMGFAVPVSQWLRGPLREWAEDLLSETVMEKQGYLNPGAIREKWKEHITGQRDWHYHLWDVLMFQSWLDCDH